MESLRIEHSGFGTEAVPYETAWQHQRDVHAAVVNGQPNTVLLLEHQPVYTAGRRTEPHERPFDGTPVIDVDRGGKITWHGPGQLVGYPIVRLAQPVDVVAYVRRLEAMLIEICAALGVHAIQVEGRSGAWLPADEHRPERKIAAIGIRVAQGVTMHGFSINCDPDLGGFSQIVPCGIPDAGVTSLSAELGRDVTVSEVLPITEDALRRCDLSGIGTADAAHLVTTIPSGADLFGSVPTGAISAESDRFDIEAHPAADDRVPVGAHSRASVGETVSSAIEELARSLKGSLKGGQ
jgi:lipoyl(octanoyl) transferase